MRLHCLPRLALHVSLKAVARLRPRARASAPRFPDYYPNVGPQLRPPQPGPALQPFRSCSPPMAEMGMFALRSCHWCGRVRQPRCYNCWIVERTPCDLCEEGYPEGRGGVGLLVRTLLQKGMPSSVAQKVVETMCGTMADDVRPGARRWHLSCVLRSMRRGPPNESPFLLLAARPGWIPDDDENPRPLFKSCRPQTCFHLIFLFLGEKW